MESRIIRKRHSVSGLMCHLACAVTYRRVVVNKRPIDQWQKCRRHPRFEKLTRNQRQGHRMAEKAVAGLWKYLLGHVPDNDRTGSQKQAHHSPGIFVGESGSFEKFSGCRHLIAQKMPAQRRQTFSARALSHGLAHLLDVLYGENGLPIGIPDAAGEPALVSL